MEISTLDHVPGRTVTKHIGLVRGNTVRAKNIGRDFMAGLKNIVGGEMSGYTELLSEAREQALGRMVDAAQGAGANAILNVRFEAASLVQGAVEILVYGTAVVVE